MQPADEQLNRPGGLAERLYGMREAAGLGAGALADRLGWPPSKVSKIQNGQQRPSARDAAEWATACGHPEQAAELQDMATQIGVIHRQWKHRIRRGHASTQEDLDQAVRAAKRIRNVEVAVIPGLLQTPDYARQIVAMSAEFHQRPAGEIEPAVAARMRRQEALYDTSRVFEFVITEGVLKRRVGTPQVMAGQLDRLATLSALPNITLGILPDDAELRLIPGECFMLVDDVAYLETWVIEDTAEGDEAATYARVADILLAEAVTGDEARALIVAAAEVLRA